jgi:hypothetical protein
MVTSFLSPGGDDFSTDGVEVLWLGNAHASAQIQQRFSYRAQNKLVPRLDEGESVTLLKPDLLADFAGDRNLASPAHFYSDHDETSEECCFIGCDLLYPIIIQMSNILL